MIDLTVLYYTANVLKEPFATNAREILWRSKGDYPLISISHQPMTYGENIVVDYPRGVPSIYRQILLGAKAATTDFVAMAEDDTLYSPEHFNFRPKPDEFAYDMARWSIFSWTTPPTYSLKYRISNSTMIAPRKLLIEALEERFARYPDESKIPLPYFGELGKYEGALGVTVRKTVQYTATTPCVVFSHPDALGYGFQGNRKRMGELRAYEIPFWGTADHMIKNIYN